MASHTALVCESAPILSALVLLCASCSDGLLAADPMGSKTSGVIGGAMADSLKFQEPAQEGTAERLRLAGASWGRAVDVYALDPTTGARELALEDLAIDPLEVGASAEIDLADSLAGAGHALTIRHPLGSAAFEGELERLAGGLVPLEEGAALPRDAVLVLRFDDLLDPATVTPQAVGLRVDGQPVSASARVCATHGAVANGQWRSSRLLVDLAPALASAPGADVELDLATAGYGSLANLSGHGLMASGSSAEVALAFRAATLPGGVLDDADPPYVVGQLAGILNTVAPGSGPKTFNVEFTFQTPACALTPAEGDLLLTSANGAEVIASSAPSGGTVKMRVRLRYGDPTLFSSGIAQIRARWTPSVTAPPECFVTFKPEPAAPPAKGVKTAATIELLFSEAMDPLSVRAFDTFRIAYGQPASTSPLAEHVVGTVLPSVNLAQYEFQPTLPLRHTAGASEPYFVELTGGTQGVRDLAGNPLAFDLPQTTFTLDASEASQDTGSLSLTFDEVDEDGDGAPELRGQALYDFTNATIKSRPVLRFSSVVDPTKPLVGAMIPYPSGVQTPLNQFGAKMMSIWRYVDMGFGLLDDSFHNLDVEGLSWAPFGGAAFADQFTEFQMALAHARFLPDEVTSAGLLPAFKESGLVVTYNQNLVSAGEDPLSIVHDKSKGYTVDPSDLFLASTGTPMMPWPMNRNIPLSDFTYWTWRDTAKLSRGAPNCGGADPQRLQQVLGPNFGLLGFYGPNDVPTIGLPLLTEFRCYPDAAALGTNRLQTSFALNSSYKPTFRAYSAGGVTTSGTKIVNPDSEPTATGGVSSSGLPTGPIDNTVYWGQADFVVRVSRAQTRWLDTGAANSILTTVAAKQLPAGTQVSLAYRGARALHASSGEPWFDARNLDPYGESYTAGQLNLLQLPPQNAFTVRFYPNTDSPRWTENAGQLAGARYIQARISFVGNAMTAETPSLDGFGISWRR
jgi:Bacterial Ig-like domain